MADHRAPRSPLELCVLRPVFLDYYLNDEGDTMWAGFPNWLNCELLLVLRIAITISGAIRLKT